MRSEYSIQRLSVSIMLITLLSKLLGFCRELFFSYHFGATGAADAYIFSLTVSTILFGFIGSGMKTSFVPVYTQLQEKEGTAAANRFTNQILTLYLLISTVLILLMEAKTGWIVKLLASGFDADTTEIAVKFCRFSVLTIVATGFVGIMSGLLQSNGSYLPAAAVGLPLNAALIISIVLSKGNDYSVLGIGSVVASYLQVIILIPWTIKAHYYYKPSFHFQNESIKEILCLSGPIILSASVNQLNVLIDKSLASNVVGGISTMNYAHTVISIINDVVTAAFATALYPRLSAAYARGDEQKSNSYLQETLASLMSLLIPMTVGLLLCCKEIVQILFERGAFSDDAAQITSAVLFCYALGIPFVGIRQILIRFFYSRHDTRTPTRNAACAVCINIALNYPLMKIMGIRGLALATSISAVAADYLLWKSAKKTSKFQMTLQSKSQIIRAALCAAFMGVTAFFARSTLINRWNIYFVFGVTVFISILAYGVVGKLMHLELIDTILLHMRRKNETEGSI